MDHIPTPAPRQWYKDFKTGKLRWTRKQFVQWTRPQGLLNVRYAVFAGRDEDLLIPAYCLTPETRAMLRKV